MEQVSQPTLKRTAAGKWNCVSGLLAFILLGLPCFQGYAQMPPKAAFTVVIDAGHGGKDPGAVGKNSYEKNIALAIAKKTGYYIESLMPDVKVIYTRKTDVFLDLDVRANIANKANADLFMSIHVDGVESPSAYGTSTYVMGATKNEGNLALAKKENQVIELEEGGREKYKDFNPNDPTSLIALNLMQQEFEKQSLNAASKVQDHFRTRANRRDRGVHSAPLLVLWQTTMPSILIETGFITNPKEEQFLNTDYGQDQIATSIYEAFKAYKLDIDKRTTVAGTENASEPEVRNIDNPVSGELKIVETKEPETKPQTTQIKQEEKPVKKEETRIVASDKASNTANTATTSTTANSGVEYRVQVMASEKRVPLNHSSFKGQSGIEEIREGAYYKYVSRPVKTFLEAQSLQKTLARNFSGAFIVAYMNGAKTSVQEAKAREK